MVDNKNSLYSEIESTRIVHREASHCNKDYMPVTRQTIRRTYGTRK